AGPPDPPVLCHRRSPSPRPSARHLETLAERNQFATKAVGIRGRSRPTLQHATLALALDANRAAVLRRGVNAGSTPLLAHSVFHAPLLTGEVRGSPPPGSLSN